MRDKRVFLDRAFVVSGLRTDLASTLSGESSLASVNAFLVSRERRAARGGDRRSGCGRADELGAGACALIRAPVSRERRLIASDRSARSLRPEGFGCHGLTSPSTSTGDRLDGGSESRFRRLASMRRGVRRSSWQARLDGCSERTSWQVGAGTGSPGRRTRSQRAPGTRTTAGRCTDRPSQARPGGRRCACAHRRSSRGMDARPFARRTNDRTIGIWT